MRTMKTASHSRQPKFHYAWVIAAVTFVVLLVTAGIRATPGVLMVPLQSEFGWSNAAISVAIAINIALFGLIGPFAASLMDRVGLRRVVVCALALLAVAVALTTQMHAQWQLVLFWGVCVGSGTGVTSMVLAAIIANRWFDTHRGLVLGTLSAANATGQLLFLPLLASLVGRHGWRSVPVVVACSAVVAFVLVLAFMRDSPSNLGLLPYGQTQAVEAPRARSLAPFAALRLAMRAPAFWVLAGSFFVCGASTNGLVGTHLIPACHDVGINEVHAAGLLAMMGVFDIIGTTASGWFTDKVQARYLLFLYYLLRGLSLLFLPYVLAQDQAHLNWFAIFYGLDWVATILHGETDRRAALWASECRRDLWLDCGRSSAWCGPGRRGRGAIRTHTGHYQNAFWIAGLVCALTGLAFLFTAKPLSGRHDPEGHVLRTMVEAEA